MKKTPLFLFAITAFTLASCTEDESVNLNQGKAIDFRPALGTRANETTNANLNEISVAAFQGDQIKPFFNPTLFTKDADNYFTSTPEYYWPGDDSQIDFYAYSPAAPGGVLTMNADTKTLTDFSPAADVAQQVDFITSNASGKKSTNENSGVELTFDHRLAQIEIQAKSENEAYVFRISGVRIGKPISKGSFDFSSNTWTLDSDKAVYEETYSTPKTLGADPVNVMGDEGNAMLIPQQLTAWDPDGDASNSAAGAYLSVKLQINTIAGAQVYPFPTNGNCMWAAIPISDNWVAGKKYIYTLDFTHGSGFVDPENPNPGEPVLGGPIKFKVNVTDWDSDEVETPMQTY